jgi:hypothetical protein
VSPSMSGVHIVTVVGHFMSSLGNNCEVTLESDIILNSLSFPKLTYNHLSE